MKKIAFFIALLISVSCFAQNKAALKDIEAINFYGVDFSKGKVYAASESGDQFKYAFREINTLFISEARKYDVAKFLKKRVLGVYIDDVRTRIASRSIDDIFTFDSEFSLDDSAIKGILSSLSIKEAGGTGVIIITERVDKTQNRAYYRIVFFDVKTRNIIDSWKSSGKGKGFGLRNFWAHSVREVLKYSESALK